jgi:transketolase
MQDYQGVIFSSGVTVWTSLRVKELLEQKNINFSVIDIFKIKPINKQILKNYCNNISKIIVIEESLCEGSLAELIALNIIENSKINLFRTFNLGDKYILGSAKREWAWKKYNLEALDIFNVIYKSI